ncbi:arylsulfatase [bacterium]|nr:arylsulfatase [bacterium]
MKTGNTLQPNIVLILTDDQGWGDLGYTGNTSISTPNIDRLAREGAIMERFYVQPLCAPTRAEILTGRCFPRTGVHGVTRGQERMNLDEVTVAQVLKTAGYATGCFGKWHNGSAYPYHPNGRGFDEFYGFCCGHWSDYFQSTIERNGEEVVAPGYLPDACTDEAMAFIERNRDRPFFCYLPLNIPHSPFQVPDRYWDRLKDLDLPQRATDAAKEKLSETRAALAMCENIDWNVGRVVGKLNELGLAAQTIVIYLSDNGPNTHRWNGGMRGIKGSIDEGGVRSPCSFTWPGRIAPGTRVGHVAGSIDFLPTLADFAGVKDAKTKPLDGVSLRSLLEGRAEEWPDRAIFAQSINFRYTSMRTARYRACVGGDALYDMVDDFRQTRDLAAERPDEWRRQRGEIERWRTEMLPEGGMRPLRIPVGYREFPTTSLRPEDGDPHGAITWSSIHPNSSFLTNWRDGADSVSWELDVANEGEYDVTLHYTCKPENVGAGIEAVCGAARVGCTVTEAFDPPLRTGEDRSPRDSSYMKPFKTLALGRLRLKAGQQTIELRATKKAGAEMIDVGELRLRLL